jgi:hypothetical protein
MSTFSKKIVKPHYHQLEFEVRVYLTHLEASGARLWEAAGVQADEQHHPR